MSREELETIAKGSGIVVIGMIVSKIFNYLYRLLVARYLGPESYGLLTLGFAVLGLFSTLAILGLNAGVLRYVSFYKGKKDNERIKGTISSSLKISLPISLLIALVMFLFSDFISNSIFHNTNLAQIIKIFSLLVPILAIISNLESVTQAFQKIKYNIFIRNISESGIQFVVTLILFVIGFGLIGAVYGYLIALISSAIIFLYIVNKKVFPFIKTKIKSINNYKELILFTWPLTFVSIIGILQSWGDNVFIGIFKTVSDVGIFNAALPMAHLLLIASTTISFLFIPIITGLYAKDEMNSVKEVYKTTNKWIFFLNLPILFILTLFSKQVLLILFGQEYVSGYIVLMLLSLGYFIYSLSQLSSGILQSVKKTKFILINSIAVTSLNIILNLILIPKYGIMGAGISSLASFVLGYLILNVKIYSYLKLHPFSKSMLKSFFSALIAILVSYILKELLSISSDILTVIVIGSIFISIYIGLLLITRSITKEDILIIKSIIKRNNNTELN